MRSIVLLLVFLLGLATPAFADDVTAAQSVIRAQEQAFIRGDAVAAYSHAAPEIKQMFPQADIFMQMVQQAYPPIYRHKSFEFGEARAAGGRMAQRVHIVDDNGEAWEAMYTLEQQTGRQFEDHRVFAVEGRSGGLAPQKGFVDARSTRKPAGPIMEAMAYTIYGNPG